MEFHGLHGQIYLMQNLNQDYEDCPAFRKQLTIFGRLGYNVNLIFNRIKAGQTTSIRTNRTNRLIYCSRRIDFDQVNLRMRIVGISIRKSMGKAENTVRGC